MFVGEWMLLSLFEEINVLKILRTNISKVQADYIVELSLLDADDEESLRLSYKNCFMEAKNKGFSSIAFPLAYLGDDSYSREEGFRVAVEEINSFLLLNNMDVFLVVEGERYKPLDLELMDRLRTYVYDYYTNLSTATRGVGSGYGFDNFKKNRFADKIERVMEMRMPEAVNSDLQMEVMDEKLAERMTHRSDTFSQYLMFLIESKGMSGSEVYKRALITKQLFSSMKNDVDYRPTKEAALRFCIGAKLNLDESKDLLSRAGYALSPCEKRDIIFSFFIENEHYDLIDIDIQLEEYGLPCIIS